MNLLCAVSRAQEHKAKTHLGHLNVLILASTSVPSRPTTVQMPNLALIETKRFKVHVA